MSRLDNAILNLLETGQSVALATIVSLSGSAPRTAGTKMAIRRDGGILGTIGGGRLEAEVIQAGQKILATSASLVQRFELTALDAQGMDMICGGVLDVLVEPLHPDERTIALLRALRGPLADGRRRFLATLLQESPQGLIAQRFVIDHDGHAPAFCPDAPSDARFILEHLDAARDKRGPTLFTTHSGQVLIEPMASGCTVHLFGAGHVALEVAALARRMDFQVEVYDDRPEFANVERFPHAKAVHVPADLDAAVDSRRITDKDYVVIVTRGHQHDLEVLNQALRTEACYIGMIGSLRKREAIYTALHQRGVSLTDLKQVHCPIGLSIGAQTPAEIALSIVAELVAVRAKQNTVRKNSAPNH